MTPLVAITAVRAAIRIGRTAADAFAQYAQERPILIPDADRFQADDLTIQIHGIADENSEFAKLLESDEELARLWQDGQVLPGSPAEKAVFAVAVRYVERSVGEGAHLSAQTDEELAGGMMVGQWAEGKGPVTPAMRVVVAMADVALEYVGSNPQVLGIGGDGEKLIGAIALAVSEAIPDSDTRESLGPKDRFAERLAALVLHSGLKTISENPDMVFSESHMQELLANVLPPVLDALPGDTVAEQVEWRQVTDAFLGPAVSAALETVAASPTAFLGKKFAAEKAAGVVVTGLLNAAKDVEVKDRFTKEGLFTLFQATARIAAENPELILGELLDTDLKDPANRKKADAVTLTLFQSVADVLKDRKPPFGDDLGTAVAVAVIDGLGQSGAVLFDQDNPWQKVTGDITGEILDGLTEALGDEAKTLSDTVFSKERLLDLAGVFVAQIAATPHMIAGGDGEVTRIVSAVTTAMAQDKNLLLTADDWIKIAGVAAQEASLNPGRLFGLSDTSLQGKLAADIIGGLLKAAGEDLTRDGREVGPVLVGETLREAILVTLRAMGGNIEQASEHRVDIETLARTLNEAVGDRGLKMGGKEWSHLFRALLPGALTLGEIPVLDDAKIAALLGAN